jgi:phosphoribosylformylglycinamidine cyclo-ligase
VPAIFELIRESGQVDISEMRKAFNMGAGMLLVVDEGDLDRAMELLGKSGEEHFIAGEITSAEGIIFQD